MPLAKLSSKGQLVLPKRIRKAIKADTGTVFRVTPKINTLCPLNTLCFPKGGVVMNIKDVLEKALKLKPEERFLVIEGLLKSLDEPDRGLDDIWADEAERRLKAYREGRLEGVPVVTGYSLKEISPQRNQLRTQ
ncbi:MAG: addiction module protein [Thermodesulfobacteriota bacterium]